MLYFIDSEFIESFHKPFFGKRRHFIDLISISLIAEDGRKYNAISSEYRFRDASDWVKENVIRPLYSNKVSGLGRQFIHPDNFHKQPGIGKSNAQIAKEIVAFVNPGLNYPESAHAVSEVGKGENLYDHFEKHDVAVINGHYVARPQFYADYADYDWVLFCSLFGTMMDLPAGFPMFCNDIQQMFNDTVRMEMRHNRVPMSRFDEYSKLFKERPEYPKEENCHLSEYDVRYCKDQYDYFTLTQNVLLMRLREQNPNDNG